MKREHNDSTYPADKRLKTEEEFSETNSSETRSESTGNYEYDSDVEVEYTTIRLPYKGEVITANEVGMNVGYVDLTPDNQEIEALCSYGFASCIAIIVKSSDNKYISLRHDSVCEHDYAEIHEYIDNKKAEISNLAVSSDVEVKIGFSWEAFMEDADTELKMGDEYLTQEAYEQRIKLKRDFLETLKGKYSTGEIIDLPQSTILIDRNGAIDISIPQEIMENASEVTEGRSSPSASPKSSTIGSPDQKIEGRS